MKDILDWILRIVGILALLKCPFSLIFNLLKDRDIPSNINITNKPSQERLNNLTFYSEVSPEGHSSGDESTLLSPTDSCIYNVRLYELSLNKKGKLKKGKVIFKEKKLSPNYGILFNKYKNCGAPSYMVSWKNKLGYVAQYKFAENGFNGNTNLNIIEYKTSFVNYVFNFIFYK